MPLSNHSPSAHFYRDLPAAPSLEAAMAPSAQADVPDDWYCVVADVVRSTQAIAAGAYKQVNTVGVACIAALVNIDRSLSLPFVFGGDGATFAVPASHLEPVICALRGAQQLAMQQFGLQLRAGLVPVDKLRRAGHEVKVARVVLSDHMSQALLAGTGWAEAERRIKAGLQDASVLYVQPDDGPAEASFDGFECRWQQVPSFQDHKLALIVVARATDPIQAQHTYLQVLECLREVLGSDINTHHPLRAGCMRLTFSPRQLMGEWRVRTAGLTWAGKLGNVFKTWKHPKELLGVSSTQQRQYAHAAAKDKLPADRTSHTQGQISRRDELGGAVARAGGAAGAGRPPEGHGPSAICARDDVAPALHAAVVWSE